MHLDKSLAQLPPTHYNHRLRTEAPEYCTVQYSTVQYSTVQYSTVQYSTVQYIHTLAALHHTHHSSIKLHDLMLVIWFHHNTIWLHHSLKQCITAIQRCHKMTQRGMGTMSAAQFGHLGLPWPAGSQHLPQGFLQLASKNHPHSTESHLNAAYVPTNQSHSTAES